MKSIITYLGTLSALCGATFAVVDEEPLSEANPVIAPRVSSSQDKSQFEAVSFGAVSNGLTPCTEAIQKAINAAGAAGGGKVVFAKGIYMTGALFLKSNVELHLGDGVILRAIPDEAAFPEIASRSAGIEMNWPAAIVNAIGCKNVKLTGKGVIDGSGDFWWRKYWGDDRKGGMRADYERRGLRWAVDWDCKRPQSVLFKDCEALEISGLTILRSPFWTLQLTYCQGVHVDGLTIRNNIGGYGPSSDGIDVDSSRDVLIENCDIECYDDNICLKAGRDADGLRVNRPTENVVVRNCITRTGHGMFTLGSETAGGIRNVEVYNLRAIGTRTGIRFKSAQPRGGVVENIRIHDIVMEDVENPISMSIGAVNDYPLPAGTLEAELPAHWKTLTQKVQPPGLGVPEFRNISISNVTASGGAQAFEIKGHPEKPIRNLHFSNVKIQAGKAGKIAYADNWKMEKVAIEAADLRPLQLEDCHEVSLPELLQINAAVVAKPAAITLEVVAEHHGPLIGPGSPGTEANKSGFETGCVVAQDGIFHMFVNEMFGLAHRDLRIAHWTSVNGSEWTRQGTAVESIEGRTPLNPRAEVWLTGIAYDAVESRWNLFYVGYRGGDGSRGEIAGSDYEGKIWRAASLVRGRDGIGGPYRDIDIIMRPDEHSLAWEGQQGVDSFFPYQVGEKWYGFYGSHNHLPKGPWLVGLAEAPTLAGPWTRVPAASPTPMVKEFIENPVVQEIAPGRWLALYDSSSAHAVGYSTSNDGVNWSPEELLIVQSENNRWSGDNGLWDVRTPLGLLPQPDGTYTLIYTAKLKSQTFWAIGQCTVRLGGQKPSTGVVVR